MEVSVVEKIHNEFNNSFIIAEEQLSKSIDLLRIEIENKPKIENDVAYNAISDYFKSSESITKRNEIESESKKYINNFKDHQLFLEEINRFKKLYPNNRLIAYAQIDEILKRWDLYMGISTKFVGEIPTENAKQIADYIKLGNSLGSSKTRHDYFGYSTTYDYKYIEYRIDQPTFSPRNPSKESSIPNLYICAPMDNFNPIDMQVCEREIFYAKGPKFRMVPATVMDPIVVSPLNFYSNIGRQLRIYHVVSAWGPESKDEYLVGKSKF